MDAPYPMSAAQQSAASALAADLQRVFGQRLHALVAYGLAGPDQLLHTLALVDEVRFADLSACAPSVHRWRRAGLAVPLLLRGTSSSDRSTSSPSRTAKSSPTTSPSSDTIHLPARDRGGRPAQVVRAAGEEPSDSLARGFSGGRRGSERNGLPDRIISHGFRALLGNIARLDRGRSDRAHRVRRPRACRVRRAHDRRAGIGGDRGARLQADRRDDCGSQRAPQPLRGGDRTDLGIRGRMEPPMTWRLGFGWAIFFLVLSQCPAVLAQPLPPQLTAPVNDFAHVIDPSSAQEIIAVSGRWRRRPGTWSSWLTVPLSSRTGTSRSTDSQDLRERREGHRGPRQGQWRARRCRRQGSESGNRGRLRPRGVITDGFAGQTIREAILPEFRSGNFGRGLVLARADHQPDRGGRGVNLQDVPRDAPRQQPQFHIPIWNHHLSILFIILMMTRGRRRRRRYWGGPGAAGIAASGRSVEASVAASEDLAAAVVVAAASADSVEAGAAVVERRGGESVR